MSWAEPRYGGLEGRGRTVSNVVFSGMGSFVTGSETRGPADFCSLS